MECVNGPGCALMRSHTSTTLVAVLCAVSLPLARSHGSMISPIPRHILQMPEYARNDLSTSPGYPMAWNRQMWQL